MTSWFDHKKGNNCGASVQQRESNPALKQRAAIASAGASSHCCGHDPRTKTGTTKAPIAVESPSGDLLQSTARARQLAPSQLSDQACEARVVPGLMRSSLLQIGKLCSAGCGATFIEREAQITKDDQLLLAMTGQ
jgi:hypothetical protein